jgi:hypothetical protein
MRYKILLALMGLILLSLLVPGKALVPGTVPGALSLAQAPPPDPRFGVVDAYVNSTVASEAGAGYTRITFQWDVIQPAGVDDWKPANVPDPFLDAELAAGREVVGVLMGTPTWAAADGSGSPKAVPDMSYWENFVRRMAQQYRGRIRHWIIWNQPDVSDVNHPGNTWTGSEQDYFRLLKTAYLAIKDEDPTLQVHLAGLTYFWDQERGQRQYLDRLLDIIVADPEAAAQGYYFDAVAYHLYFDPRQTMDIIGEVQGTLGARGIMAKQIWINQTNAPPSEDPAAPIGSPVFRVSLEEQSAFVIQEFALALAGGADRVAFYKLRDSPGDPGAVEPYGLLRADDSRRPALDAYRVVTTYLRDYQAVQWQRLGDVYAVSFDRGEVTTTVLWTMTRDPTSFVVNAIAPQATLVDETGNTQTIDALNGTYSVELPGAMCTQETNCFIGGAPRLLVEAGSPAARLGLVPAVAPIPTPESTAEAGGEAAMLTPTLDAAAPTPLAQATPAVAQVTSQPRPVVVTPTSTAVAQSPAASVTPEPTPTLLPPISPMSILTPARCLILIIVGLVVFTVTYGVQMALWWRRRR